MLLSIISFIGGVLVSFLSVVLLLHQRRRKVSEGLDRWFVPQPGDPPFVRAAIMVARACPEEWEVTSLTVKHPELGELAKKYNAGAGLDYAYQLGKYAITKGQYERIQRAVYDGWSLDFMRSRMDRLTGETRAAVDKMMGRVSEMEEKVPCSDT